MKILLLNGGVKFHENGGSLNACLHRVAEEVLTQQGHELKQTHIDHGYDCQEEVQKYLWADVVIYQMPAWWMGMPWHVKQYVDEVFMAGVGQLWANDGRHRADDPTKGYGTGGLLQGKRYMLSVTWNAPERAFTDPEEFFEGVGVDGVYLHFHKLNQFLGMTAMTTFMLNDVVKSPKFDVFLERYRQHLMQYFSQV